MGKRFRNGVLVATVLAAFVPVLHAALPAQAAATTTVAITFDDGFANQAAAVPILDAHGMKATFYVNSGVIDQPGWLSWSQLLAFQTDGQEIGGHTLNNVNLNTLVAPDTAQNEVCEDRGRLMKHGLNVTSFSYPFGEYYLTPAGLTAVSTACGNNSARDQYGLYDPNPAHCPNNDGCAYPYAAQIPPTDPFSIPTATNVDKTTTLAELEGYVTRAQANGGGLVPFVFHQICNGCETYSTSSAVFSQFLDWLQTQAGNGTTVQTMNGVIGGTMSASPGTADVTAPTSAIQCGGAPCDPAYAEGTVVPVSFNSADELNGSGIDAVRYTLDGTSPTIDSPVYASSFNVTYNTTVKFAAWDNAGNVEATNTQTIAIADTTAPVSTIACNGAPCSAWLSGGTQVSLSATDAGSGVKEIRYTTDGAAPTMTSPVYTGPFALSASATVQYFAVDKANNAEVPTHSQAFSFESIAPTSSMLCNGGPCSSNWSNLPAQVSLSGADTGGSGLAAIRYTTDGSVPTPSSAAYTVPFTVSSGKTVTWRAYDNAGNAEAPHSQLLQIDTLAPVATVKCNNGTCTTAWHHAAAHVTLAASDAGGSGVASIRYTVDGSTPSGSSAAYSAPIALSATKTVKFRAFDNAGNAGAVKSIVVNVDTVKPTVSVKAPGVQAQSTGTLRITAKASDQQSKVVRVNFYVDRKFIRGDTKAPFKFAWSAKHAKKGVHTLTVKAIDGAGNIGVEVIKFRVR